MSLTCFPVQQQCAHPNQEDHLSADISVAVRQYYRATGDKKWLATKGLPLVLGSHPLGSTPRLAS